MGQEHGRVKLLFQYGLSLPMFKTEYFGLLSQQGQIACRSQAYNIVLVYKIGGYDPGKGRYPYACEGSLERIKESFGVV